MASSPLIRELTDALIALGALTRDARAARLLQEPSQRLAQSVTAHAHHPTQDSYSFCARAVQEMLERIALCEASGFCTSIDATRQARTVLLLRVRALELISRDPQPTKRVAPKRARVERTQSAPTHTVPASPESNGEQRYGDVLGFIRTHPNVALNEVIQAFPEHSRRTVQRAVQFLVRGRVVKRIVDGRSVTYAAR